MTSEIENILKGQVVSKTNDLKQIAVSTANLTPDANGIAPLEKQSAFVSSQNNEQPQPSEFENNANTPVISSDQVISIHPATEVSAPVLENQPLQVDNTVSPTDNSENIESIEYNKPTQDGVLLESPVEVKSTESLDSINFGAVGNIVDQLTAVEEKPAPVVEEAQKMDMPVMDSVINAQEPSSQDNRLFVDNNLTQSDNSTLVVPEAPATTITPEASVVPEVPATPDAIENQVSTVSEPIVANDQTSVTPFEIPPVEWPELTNTETQPLLNPLTDNNAVVQEESTETPIVTAESSNEAPSASVESSIETPTVPIQEVVQNTEVPLIDPTISEFSLQPQKLVEPTNVENEPAENVMNNDTEIHPTNTFIPPLTDEKDSIPSMEEKIDTTTTEVKSIFEDEKLEEALEPLFDKFKRELVIAVNEYINSKDELEKNSLPSEQILNSNFLEQPLPTISENIESVVPSTLEQNNEIPVENTSNIEENTIQVDEELVHGKFI